MAGEQTLRPSDPGRQSDNGRQSEPGRSDTVSQNFTLAAVARHLDISVESLQRLRRRFGHYLGPDASAAEPLFSSADVAAIVTIQKLLSQGYDDEQIDEHLTPVHLDVEATPSPFPTGVQPYNNDSDGVSNRCRRLWAMC